MKMLKIDLKSTERQELINLTDDLEKLIEESNVSEGICILFNPHTTAALTLNSRVDPTTAADVVEELDRVIPTRVDFHHVFDTPSDAAGHIKSSFIGNHLTMLISDSKLQLGGSQGVFFWEFDGPRERKFLVKIIEI